MKIYFFRQSFCNLTWWFLGIFEEKNSQRPGIYLQYKGVAGSKVCWKCPPLNENFEFLKIIIFNFISFLENLEIFKVHIELSGISVSDILYLITNCMCCIVKIRIDAIHALHLIFQPLYLLQHDLLCLPTFVNYIWVRSMWSHYFYLRVHF